MFLCLLNIIFEIGLTDNSGREVVRLWKNGSLPDLQVLVSNFSATPMLLKQDPCNLK